VELVQLWPVTHALPHVPQLELLLVRSTQLVVHTAWPAGHWEPWPPDPSGGLLGLTLLVPEAEQAAGKAAPKHKSKKSPTDLFMSGLRHAAKQARLGQNQSRLLAPNRQRKAAECLEQQIDSSVGDITPVAASVQLLSSPKYSMNRIFATAPSLCALALLLGCGGRNTASITQGAGGDLGLGSGGASSAGSAGAPGGAGGSAGAAAGTGGAAAGSAGMAVMMPTPNGGTGGAPAITCPVIDADAGVGDAGTPTYPTTCEEVGTDAPQPPVICATVKATRSAPNGVLGDQSTVDTFSIQSAITACCAGQAVELAPDGDNDAFLSGALNLKPGVSLVIDEGVTVFASRNPRDFGATCNGTANAKCSALITVSGGANMGVYGAGTLDGQGGQTIIGIDPPITWWDQENALDGDLVAPRLIQVNGSPGFVLQGIKLQSAPKFHIVFQGINGFTVWGITIHTDPKSPNTDGFDPSGCTNGVIAYNKISTGDDNIALKGSGAIDNLVIVHNHFGKGHGMSIGSETNAGVQNVKVCDLSLDGTQNGIRIKSDVSRGGEVKNISYTDVCMRSVSNPLVFNPFYDKTATGTLIPYFHDISLKNIHMLGAGTLTFRGYDATRVFTATLDNVIFDDVANVAYKGQDASITFGPGPVNIDPTGTDITVTNNVTNTDPPLDCTNAWVTF
jgi:polygalacturonase